MGRVVHFEFPAHDLDRASTFYEKVFGWTAYRWEAPGGGGPPYVLLSTGEGQPGIDGGLIKRQSPAHRANVVIDVDSVDETASAVTTAGGEILAEKAAVPGIGWVIYFADSEGNPVGAMEADPGAA